MVERPWKKARRTRSERQERGLASLEGGELQINSGRFWRWKRDVKLGNILIEARDTESRSYSINYDEFQKITKEAFQTPPGCIPGMQITIRDLPLIALRLTDFEQMRAYIEDLEIQLEILKVRE